MLRAGCCGVALTIALLGVAGCEGSPGDGAPMQAPTLSPHAASSPGVARVAASASTLPQTRRPDPAEPQPREIRGSSRWKLSRAANRGQIEGYASRVSVAPGQPVYVMVSTTAYRFRALAYRIGGYRGGEGRLVWTSRLLAGQRQAAAHVTPGTRTVTADWQASTSLPTAGWPAGFYLVKLEASSGYQAYVPLVLRSTSTVGRIVLVAPTMTWQGYNAWGGYSLYQAPPGERRSWAVSFDRPNEAPGAGQFVYNVIGTVVLAERLGLQLAYESDVDVATRPALLNGARAYVSLGHDEYWTVPERRHVTTARDIGTNLLFLSSNTMYWRVRLEATKTGPNRLVVGYKSDAHVADPLRRSDPVATTARWRDPPHPDPESSLTGMLYECFPVDAPYRVASPSWWGFRGTGVRAGTELSHLVAYEADRVYPGPLTPHPLQILSYVRYSCLGVETSSESTYYTAPSGAGVVDFGTQRWSCAVRLHCPPLRPRVGVFVRKVMTNVLRRFGEGPVGRTDPARSNVGDFPLPSVNQVPAS
jgi:hypothetical protein